MIISNDGKIVLCTPTKVGSTSLEKLVLDDHKLGKRLYSSPENIRGNKHGSICNLKIKHRFLLVRHPLERFASIYAFLRKSRGSFENDLVRAARKDDLVKFCSSYLISRETVWTKQLYSYVKEFNPTNIYKLEEAGIFQIVRQMGAKSKDIPFINRTSHRGWASLYDRLNQYKHLRQEIISIHNQSISILNY